MWQQKGESLIYVSGAIGLCWNKTERGGGGREGGRERKREEEREGKREARREAREIEIECLFDGVHLMNKYKDPNFSDCSDLWAINSTILFT